jgi:hypothetical protein
MRNCDLFVYVGRQIGLIFSHMESIKDAKFGTPPTPGVPGREGGKSSLSTASRNEIRVDCHAQVGRQGTSRTQILR